MALRDRIARIENKGLLRPGLIYYRDGQGNHVKPLLKFVQDAKSGGIQSVDLDRSAAAIGNGVLYSIACLENGFYTTDERGNAVIPTGKGDE